MSAVEPAQSSPCCEVSSAKPVPIAQFLVPTGGARIASPAVQVAGLASTGPAAVCPLESAPPLAVEHSQAVLCTFLI